MQKTYSSGYTTPHTCLIAKCLSVLLLSIATNLPAQSLTFQAGPAAPDLQCLTSKPAPRPAANPTPLEELYEIPEEDLLLELIKSLPHSPTLPEGSRGVFAKLPQSRPLHIGLWGDSHAAANFFAEELIQSVNLPKDKVLPLLFHQRSGAVGCACHFESNVKGKAGNTISPMSVGKMA